jgi:DNA replicative helicase MCM subunit Mcm2 (Cdc46/Mcm family)
VKFAESAKRVNWDVKAREKWIQVYAELSSGAPGMYGALIARAEAQCVRLATLYALLDCSVVIRVEHLDAALEVWRYCQGSVAYVFGKNATGDSTADEILKMLQSAPNGMTQTAIGDAFSRNKSATELERTIGVLQQRGMVESERQQKGRGAPTTSWKAVK